MNGKDNGDETIGKDGVIVIDNEDERSEKGFLDPNDFTKDRAIGNDGAIVIDYD